MERGQFGAASFVVTIIGLTIQAATSAQSGVPDPSGDSRKITWHLAAGYDRVALRDIARSTPPVDASPVAWRGEGASLLVQHTRARATRFHRYGFSAASDGNFAYDSGLETVVRPNNDHYGRLEGRYEYRRYFFSNVGLRGLDVGGGLQGIGSRSSITRHIPENIEAGETRAALAAGGVAALRLRRWSRFELELGWINGVHISHLGEHHSVDSAATRSRWGGGWLTDLSIGGSVAVSRQASLSVTYFRANDGLLSSHRGVTSARNSLSIGAMYAK